MDENQMMSLLSKSGITTENTGGLLGAEQSNKFVQGTIAQSNFLQEIRVETGIGLSRDLDNIGVGTRLLHHPTESVAPGDDKLKAVNTSRRSLLPKEVMLPYNVSLKYLEENIERAQAESTINTLFATQFSNDLVDLIFNGNSMVSPIDADYNFIKIMDGIFGRLAVDPSKLVYTLNGSSDWKGEVFQGMLNLLPAKYRANLSQLTFLVPYSVEDEYKEQLASRNTALGDAYATEKVSAMYKGIKVEGVPYNTKPILTNKKNLVLGFGRDISVYKMLQPRSRNIEYTITAKIDFNYIQSDAIVIAE